MEVRLLDPPLLERQLAVERGGQAEGHASLHLRLHARRVGADAAVHGAHDAVDPDAPAGDGDFGDLGHETFEGLVDGETPETPLRQRRSPTRLFRGEVQDSQVPGMVLQELAAVLQRILLRFVSERVHEASP